jgi:hypothetical protein
MFARAYIPILIRNRWYGYWPIRCIKSYEVIALNAMSDDDKKTYKQLLLIAVLAIFGILYLVAFGTLYALYGCFDIYMKRILPIPESCTNGSMSRFVLEFIAITVGVLGAIRLLGQ